MLIFGYDPGGDGSHGVASILLDNHQVSSAVVNTIRTVKQVLQWFDLQQEQTKQDCNAIGVDTLTVWSTGPSGWRPADRYLRNRYPLVANSVTSPNSLFGSMGLNGMSVVLAMKTKYPKVTVTETHPKVLFHVLSEGAKYNYQQQTKMMNEMLLSWLGIPTNVSISTEHEWDALVSALAAMRVLMWQWKNDLHSLPTEDNESLIWPAGKTHYYWP